MARRATWAKDVLDAREVEKLVRIYQDEEARLIELISRAINAGRPIYTYSAFLEQVRRELKRLTERAAPIARSIVESSYELGQREADELLRRAGKHVMDAFAYGQIHREAVELLVINTVNRLENVAQVIGRRVEDTYRAVALDALRSQIIGTQAWRSASERYREELARHGITGFTDVLGRRWNMTTYVRMVARTTPMEAHLTGSCNRLLENGVDLVKVSSHVEPCEKCAVWEGKVLSITGKTPGYTTIAEARAQGLFHPNCRHAVTGYLTPYLEEVEQEESAGGKERKPIKPENPVGVVIDWERAFPTLSPDNVRVVATAYKDAPDGRFLKAWDAFGGMIRWITGLPNKGSYYAEVGNIIHLRPGFDASVRRVFGTIRHEMGHFLDHIAGAKSTGLSKSWISMNQKTRAAIDRARRRISRDKEFFNKLKAKYFPHFDVDASAKTARPDGDFDVIAGVGDIFDALTRGKYPLNWGHGKKYWRDPGADQAEIFADICDLINSGNTKGLQILQETVPEVYQAFKETIDEALEIVMSGRGG